MPHPYIFQVLKFAFAVNLTWNVYTYIYIVIVIKTDTGYPTLHNREHAIILSLLFSIYSKSYNFQNT